MVARVMVDTAWEIAYRLGLTRDDPESFDRRLEQLGSEYGIERLVSLVEWAARS